MKPKRSKKTQTATKIYYKVPEDAGDWIAIPGRAKLLIGKKGNRPSILASEDLALLQRCEKVIPAAKSDFEIGRALKTINEMRLYVHHGDGVWDFPQYVRERWKIGKSHAYRLISAAEIAAILSPHGDLRQPTRAAQVRPLTAAGMNGDVVVRVWREADKIAGCGEITRPIVARVVEQFKKLYGVDQAPRLKHVRPLTSKAIFSIRQDVDYALQAMGTGNYEFAFQRLKAVQLQIYRIDTQGCSEPEFEI